MTTILCEEIAKIDSTNASVYTKNAAVYTKQLATLDGEYKAAVKSAKKNTSFNIRINHISSNFIYANF